MTVASASAATLLAACAGGDSEEVGGEQMGAFKEVREGHVSLRIPESWEKRNGDEEFKQRFGDDAHSVWISGDFKGQITPEGQSALKGSREVLAHLASTGYETAKDFAVGQGQEQPIDGAADAYRMPFEFTDVNGTRQYSWWFVATGEDPTTHAVVSLNFEQRNDELAQRIFESLTFHDSKRVQFG